MLHCKMTCQPTIRIALFQPEIAGNVGTVLRLAACMGVTVDLIEPMGFPWGDRARKRAAMDYEAETVRHADWEAFEARVRGRLVLFTTHGGIRLPEARFAPGDTLLFGAESSGVPDFVHARADAAGIPLRPEVRSLNLAVATCIGLAEALRQTEEFPQ